MQPSAAPGSPSRALNPQAKPYVPPGALCHANSLSQSCAFERTGLNMRLHAVRPWFGLAELVQYVLLKEW